MYLKGVSVATWTRMVVLVLLLINQVSISIFNFTLLPFEDESIYEGVSTVLTFVASLVAGWKNNSFTEKAQEADKILRGAK